LQYMDDWLKYAFAVCLSITIVLISAVFFYGNGDDEDEEAQRIAAKLIASDVAKRVTRRATHERALEIEQQEATERQERQDMLEQQVANHMETFDKDSVPRITFPKSNAKSTRTAAPAPAPAPARRTHKTEQEIYDEENINITRQIPKKIVRDPKVVAFEKDVEQRACDMFEDLAKSVKEGSS